MPIVTVKTKYQVVIPAKVRQEVGVEVGDILEAKVEKGKITLTPKTIVDRGILEGLADVRQGRVSPAFSSAQEAIRYLHQRVKKQIAKK